MLAILPLVADEVPDDGVRGELQGVGVLRRALEQLHVPCLQNRLLRLVQETCGRDMVVSGVGVMTPLKCARGEPSAVGHRCAGL